MSCDLLVLRGVTGPRANESREKRLLRCPPLSPLRRAVFLVELLVVNLPYRPDLHYPSFFALPRIISTSKLDVFAWRAWGKKTGFPPCFVSTLQPLEKTDFTLKKPPKTAHSRLP